MRRVGASDRRASRIAGYDASAALQALVASLGGWWWDGRTGIVIAGSGVSSWTDRVQGAVVSQGTDAKRPTYSATTGLTFVKASAQTLVGAANVLSGKAAKTMLVFASFSGNGNENAIAYGTAAPNDAGIYCAPAGLSSYIRGGGQLNNWQTALTTPFALATYTGTALCSDGVTAEKQMYKNGTQSGVGGSRTIANDMTAITLPAASLSIGAYIDGTLPIDMVLRHAIVLPVQASAAQVAQMDALLHQIEGVLSPMLGVFVGGDSIVRGKNGLTGGWRPGVASALGLNYELLGPFSDTGHHRGVDGETAAAVAADLGTYAAQLAAYNNVRRVVIAWGENDLGGGATPAAFYASLNAIIDQTQTTLPLATIVVQSIVPPTAGHAYFANLANYTTVNAALPALCAAQGVRFANIGSPDNTIGSGSDGVHPIDGAGGYPVMVAPTLAQVA